MYGLASRRKKLNVVNSVLFWNPLKTTIAPMGFFVVGPSFFYKRRLESTLPDCWSRPVLLFDSIKIRLILGEKKRNLVVIVIIVVVLSPKNKQQDEGKHSEKKPKNSP